MSLKRQTTDPPLVPDPLGVVAPEAEQIVNIRPGSSLAVIGVFVEVIRKRFKPEFKLPWFWDFDTKKTTIDIDSAFNEDKENSNKRPAIFVDRDDMVLGRTVLGDVAAQSLTTGLKAFWALQSVPILIECVAAKKGESAIIADLVAIFLHASSDLIQGKFAFHEMTPVTVGRSQPYPRDKQQWVTSVTFNVQYDLRWTNRPTGPLLQEIEAAIEASGVEDATQFFETIAVSSLSK